MVPNIRRSLQKFAPQFLEAREKAVNEADTVDRLRNFFEDVLGYESSEDITREAQMKHRFVDLCLKIDGTIRLLVEAKAANVKLRDRHIEQAQSYASHNNYQWVVLTNGVDWHLYHLTFDEGIEYEPAFIVSLDTEVGFDNAAQKLALIHKDSIRKGELDTFWEKSTAMCASSIGKALFTDSVMRLLRREIRRMCGVLIDPEDIAQSLHNMLSEDARVEIGPARIRRKRKKKIAGKPSAKPSDTTTTVTQSAVRSQSKP